MERQSGNDIGANSICELNFRSNHLTITTTKQHPVQPTTCLGGGWVIFMCLVNDMSRVI